jgi:hypothetical protein
MINRIVDELFLSDPDFARRPRRQCPMIQILLAIFGIIALIKGEFKITGKRKVRGSTGRVLGLIMLAGAAAPLVVVEGVALMYIALIAAIVIGLVTSEPVTA